MSEEEDLIQDILNMCLKFRNEFLDEGYRKFGNKTCPPPLYEALFISILIDFFENGKSKELIQEMLDKVLIVAETVFLGEQNGRT